MYNIIFDKALASLKDHTTEFQNQLIKLYEDNYIRLKDSNEIDLDDLQAQLELVDTLMFGVSSAGSHISTKINFNKNKTLLKSLIVNHTNFKETNSIIQFLTARIDDYLSDSLEIVGELYEAVSGNEDVYSDEEKNIVFRFVDLINSFATESTFIRSQSSQLNYILSMVKDGERQAIVPRGIKTDCLRRYYFSHVYQLKNDVKIFEPDIMIYGEINNIMRMFDRAFDFCFGDFIFFYQTIKNLTSDAI